MALVVGGIGRGRGGGVGGSGSGWADGGDADNQDEENFYGLPLSPDLLLHPLVDVIPFPPVFPTLYAFLAELTLLTEKMRQLRRRGGGGGSAAADTSCFRSAVKSLARLKVDRCCKVLPLLLPKLSAESLEIILPHLKGLLEETETAVAAAWHLFGVIAAAFGPEKTIKHFLGSIIRIFQVIKGG